MRRLTDQPDILTVTETAELLTLSEEHVRRLARARKLPARRVGRQWRFSRRQLIDWIERGPVTTQHGMDFDD